MDQRTVDPAAIEAEVDQIRSLGIDALRKRWRLMFGAPPPPGLPKDIIARMIAYRIQEEAFGGLDRKTVKLLDRLARGEKPNELNRRLKAGTVLVREYRGERHTVTVVPDGFVWREATYSSLSTIARAITGTAWNGPRFFGLRVPGGPEAEKMPEAPPPPTAKPPKHNRSSVRATGTKGFPPVLAQQAIAAILKHVDARAVQDVAAAVKAACERLPLRLGRRPAVPGRQNRADLALPRVVKPLTASANAPRSRGTDCLLKASDLDVAAARPWSSWEVARSGQSAPTRWHQ